MKITKLDEIYGRGRSINQPPTSGSVFSPLEVVTAAIAAVRVYGSYTPTSKASDSNPSTTELVRNALYNNGSKPEDVQVRTGLTDPACFTDAKKVLTWFSTLPQATIDSNDFFQNVKKIVNIGSVSTRQVGYVVALYGAYDKEVGFNTTTPIIRQWPANWGDVKMLYKQDAVVRDGRAALTTSGYLITMMLPSGHVFRWFTIHPHQVGEHISMTGHLVPDTYGKNQHDPKIKFVPERRWKREMSNKAKNAPDNSSFPDTSRPGENDTDRD